MQVSSWQFLASIYVSFDKEQDSCQGRQQPLRRQASRSKITARERPTLQARGSGWSGPAQVKMGGKKNRYLESLGIDSYICTRLIGFQRRLIFHHTARTTSIGPLSPAASMNMKSTIREFVESNQTWKSIWWPCLMMEFGHRVIWCTLYKT